MSFSIIISGTQIASAIYRGVADQEWMKSFVSGALANPWINKVVQGTKQILSAVINVIKQAWDFFKKWFKDDPIGASAGLALGIISLGVIVYIAGAAAAFVGGLSFFSLIKAAVVGALALVSVGAILRHIVRSVQFIWNFDFNITDEKIAKQQEAALNGLYTLAGDALGNLLGSVVCGSSVAAGVGIVRFDVKAAVNVIRVMAADEDIRDEITSRFDTLISGSLRVASKIAFLEIYKNTRKWIKAAAKNPLVKSVLPGSWSKIIAAWGEPGSEPFIISEKIEEAIENIKDEKVRNFTEAFYEAFTDACTETTLTLSTANI